MNEDLKYNYAKMVIGDGLSLLKSKGITRIPPGLNLLSCRNLDSIPFLLHTFKYYLWKPWKNGSRK
jgi:hypothetical protein